MPDEEDEQFDPIPAMEAQADQNAEMSPMIARQHRAFYDALRLQGFSEHQAIYLTAAWFNDNPGLFPTLGR